MPAFGNRSKENLIECHVDLITLFNVIIESIDCSVIEGNRGQLEQDKAFHAGKSTLLYPNSKHNSLPSMAADVVPYPIDWNDKARFYYFGGFVMATAKSLFDSSAMTHKLRWGGDWDMDHGFKDQSFHDLPHYELIEV